MQRGASYLSTPPVESHPHRGLLSRGASDGPVPDLNALVRQHSMNRTVSPPTPAASPGLDDQPAFPSLDHDEQHNEDKWPHNANASASQLHPELPATPPQPFNPHLFIHDSITNFALLQPHERRFFLEAILPVLSNTDRLHLSTLLTPMLKRDFLKDLPQELGLHILSYLEDPKDLVHASTVSSAWRRLVLDEATWKQLFEKHRFGGGSKPSLGLSAKPSRHPGVLPLAQSAPPAASQTSGPAAPRPALPRSRLPSQQTPEWSDLSADVDARALRGLGLRRQSVQQSPTSTAQAQPPAASTSRLPQETSSQSGLTEAAPSASAQNQFSMQPASSGPSFSLGQGLSQMRLQEQQQQQPQQQEDVLTMAAPSRPRMPPQFTSTMGSEVSGTSSQLPSISDPLNPVELGAAAARIEVPTLSQSTEDETSTSTSPAVGASATRPKRPSMSVPSSSASALGRPASSQEISAPLRRGISNTRAYSQTDMLSFASLPPPSSSVSSGPVYSPRALATSPESASPALPFQANPFSQPQVFPPPRSASTSNVPSMASAGTSDAAASAASSEAASSAARRQFSYQSEFKRAYLTESNWLRGPGRVLSSQAAGEEGIVTCLCFDNDYIIVGMAKKEIHVFDARSGHYVRTLRGHLQGVWAIALVSKGGFRATSSTGSRSSRPAPSARASTAATQQPVPTFDTQNLAEGASSAAVPPTASFAWQRADVASGGRPGLRRRPSSFGSARDFANSGSFTSPSSGSTDNDPALGSVCGTSAGWGQKGALAVSGSCDRTIRVWDVETGECLHVLEGHRSTVRCLKVLDNRPVAVSGSRDATVRVWDLEKGEQLQVLRGHTDHVRCLEIYGNKAVSGSYDNTCRLWDLDTGQCLYVYTGHFAQIYAVAFDGERIATGSLDSTVRIWSARTGDCLALLQGHTTLVGQLQLRDSVLVTGGSDGRVIVFSLSTLECLHRLCAHDNSVTCLQFDDRFLVTGGNDGRVKLFDFKTGQFIRELAEPCEAVWRITFREDKVVIMCRRQGRTTMSLLTFRPDEAEL